MSIKYGFFDSVAGDRRYSAEDIGRYLQGIISSGVYPDDTTSLQVLASTGMEVEVQPGRAMLNCHYMENDEPLPLTLSPGGTMDRIDAIVARLDMERRICEIAVKEGTPATTPAAPAMLRTDNTKEYMLASIYVTKLAALISQENITDTRHNADVCGWVSGLLDQGIVGVPVPSASHAQMIPTVNERGTGYELQPADTSLSIAGAAADAAAVGAALESKAPAGLIQKKYDIETDAELTAAIDDLWSSTADWSEGRFAFNMRNSVGQIYGGIWHITAYKANVSYGVIKAVGYNASHPTIMYLNKMQTWGEWEWVNPPMQLGTEYRTTERYQGKPVYKIHVDCGAWADKKQINVNLNNNQWVNAISSSGMVSGYALPFIYNGDISHANTCLYTVEGAANVGAAIRLYGGGSTFSGKATKIAIKYTKD